MRGNVSKGESTENKNKKLIEVFSKLTNLNNSNLLIMGIWIFSKLNRNHYPPIFVILMILIMNL